MKKLTLNDVINKLKNNNPTINIISEYNGTKNKNTYKCNVCGNEWNVKGKDVMNGNSGCPVCSKLKLKNKRTILKHDIFIEKVKERYGDKVTVLGEYTGTYNEIKIKYNVCGHEWTPKAFRLIGKETNCYKCSCKNTGLKIRTTHCDFVEKVNLVHKNKISVLSEYITSNDRIKVKCNNCEHEWFPYAYNILKRGCPICNSSKGETKINDILIDLNIIFKKQYVFDGLKTNIGGTPKFDFAIFENGIVTKIIEFDGIQHYKPVENWGGEERFIKQQQLDDFKNEYCSKNNIVMIRIPYFDLKLIDINYIKNKINT